MCNKSCRVISSRRLGSLVLALMELGSPKSRFTSPLNSPGACDTTIGSPFLKTLTISRHPSRTTKTGTSVSPGSQRISPLAVDRSLPNVLNIAISAPLSLGNSSSLLMTSIFVSKWKFGQCTRAAACIKHRAPMRLADISNDPVKNIATGGKTSKDRKESKRKNSAEVTDGRQHIVFIDVAEAEYQTLAGMAVGPAR